MAPTVSKGLVGSGGRGSTSLRLSRTMAANQPQLVADAYTRVAADAKGANASYYDRSWALFTVMLMTGNFVNFQTP